jgi:threonine/homoserine/homoserine lactone efflux protein
MSGIHDLTLFIVSGLLLNLMPGPDVLLVMTRSAAQGWRAGSAAAIGLSALLATSATAFTLVKWIGAAYIVYVGVKLLRQKSAAKDASLTQAASSKLGYRKIFLQGFLTNVLNPKVAIFFLAFVPQFISADAPSKALAFVILGGIFNFNSMLWCHFLAVSTAFASRRLKPAPRLAGWINRVTGGLFIALGLKLALSKQS